MVADKKREQIIEGAIKRFMHFGINKTTMNDIAEDLSVSKPSLYYYFPDKKHLIFGVIDRIFNEFFDIIKKKYNREDSLEKTLIQLTEVRAEFFSKYFMLKISEGVPDLLNDEEAKNRLRVLRQEENDFYQMIFKDAEDKGEITLDLEDVASLYIESLVGLTHVCILEMGKCAQPPKKSINHMRAKQISLSKIFVLGLSKQSKN